MNAAYRYRLVGGRGHGDRLEAPFLCQHIDHQGHTLDAFGRKVAPQRYYLVRLRGRRCVMLLSGMIHGLPSIMPQISLRIIADHREYCVCECCGSVSSIALMKMRPRGDCQKCFAYRWSFDFDAIAESATRFGQLPPAWTLPDFSP